MSSSTISAGSAMPRRSQARNSMSSGTARESLHHGFVCETVAFGQEFDHLPAIPLPFGESGRRSVD